MCCKTLGMLLQSFNDADPEKLRDVPAIEMLQLINWADGYAWDTHFPLCFPTPNRVLETGIRIVFGIGQAEMPRDRTREGNPLERRRAQWGRRAAGARRVLMGQDSPACQNCGATERLSIDHIAPLSRGGSDDLENLQVLCKSCNSSKGARTMAEWLGVGAAS